MNLQKFLKLGTSADKILFLLLMILSLSGIIFINRLLPAANYVTIEVNGKLEYILPVNENRVISVKGVLGDTNIEIKDNMARITDSPCPHKNCVKQGWIRQGALICVPNKVILIIESSRENKNHIDAITG